MALRDYDVVLYGAGGFTGRQTVAYFARHAPADLRWAIAGRHRQKLESARTMAGPSARKIDILAADSGDSASVDAVVSRTRVLLTTAGPFALYGTPVVDACVRFRTHYADISGETAWVRELIARYHDRAAADGTRIVPFCGFDSVPSDLGAFLVVRKLQAMGAASADVRAYFQMRGGVNGGTIASALHAIESGQVDGMDVRAAPRYDDRIGAWIGPFVMAPINTFTVRRSATLSTEWGAPYGDPFSYQEAMRFDPPLAGMKATAAAAALAVFGGVLRNPMTRRAVAPLLPKPGSGPSADVINRGWFKCQTIGLDLDGRAVRGEIRNQGDPGNRSTVTFVCESALALALDGSRLPGAPARGGVLTPATALGGVLVERLRRAGVTIAV